METRGLGAGSYPDAPENEEKCFEFKFVASECGFGIVYAKNYEEAIEKIKSNDYDDIIDTFDFQIENIIKIEEN